MREEAANPAPPVNKPEATKYDPSKKKMIPTAEGMVPSNVFYAQKNAERIIREAKAAEELAVMQRRLNLLESRQVPLPPLPSTRPPPWVQNEVDMDLPDP